MMSKIFYFGEKVEGYDVKVLNEREVRAGAGILFLLAIISFLNSWLIGNFQYTKIFVVLFLVDFSIRIFINPKYSPSLIIGRFLVGNQTVEYVGAPQKRFAWLIGFALAITMFYVLVIKNVIGPVNLFICLTCLLLLFFETSFGICIGCKLYNIFHQDKAELCPGNACKIEEREEIQKINFVQTLVLVSFLLFMYGVSTSALINSNEGKFTKNIPDEFNISKTDSVNQDCVVPEWAIKMGHEEKWKLHHGCQ